MTTRAEQHEQIADALLDVLRHCVGEASKIRRAELLCQACERTKLRVSDRVMRSVIEDLRLSKAGAMICSTTRDGGGYWMAATRGELNDYLRQEESRIRELAIRVRRQRSAAELPPVQMQLF